jgi:two-component system phosphate regulon response regulator PhoB
VARRIAVIDDDNDFRQFIADALCDHGWEVLDCADAFSTYDLLRTTIPDVILLDLRLNGSLAGWDILTFLELHPTLHRVPVILCSAAVDEMQHRAEWLRAHNIATLIKPFELEHLYTLLASRIGSEDASIAASA